MKSQGTIVGLICLALALIIIAVAMSCNNKDAQPTSRNRVPNLGFVSINGQDLADLKKQLADTQTAAATAADAATKAQKAQSDIQAQLEQLSKDTKPVEPPKYVYSCDDVTKCGPNELTRPGIITDFGTYDLLQNSSVTDYYIGFNFTDRMGFTKRFFPVCPNQTVKTGVPISIMYHWRNHTMESEGKRGCFMIDGFQAN